MILGLKSVCLIAHIRITKWSVLWNMSQSQRDMTDDVCPMTHALVSHNGLFVHAFVRVYPFHPMLVSMRTLECK